MSVRQYEEERQERERKLREENKRLRETLRKAKRQLLSIRGIDKSHDTEIMKLCIEVCRVLDGDSDE